jgi:hypothetical protein
MKELLVRFLVGGVVVSAFAMLGDICRPKSFAGLFGAAPSVALATLALTIRASGHEYASIESGSMVAGAIALFLYTSAGSRVIMSGRWPALAATIALLPVWFGTAFALWFVWWR